MVVKGFTFNYSFCWTWSTRIMHGSVSNHYHLSFIDFGCILGNAIVTLALFEGATTVNIDPGEKILFAG